MCLYLYRHQIYAVVCAQTGIKFMYLCVHKQASNLCICVCTNRHQIHVCAQTGIKFMCVYRQASVKKRLVSTIFAFPHNTSKKVSSSWSCECRRASNSCVCTNKKVSSIKFICVHKLASN